MIKVIPPMRKPDAYGQGHFGAPRGSRIHNGKDYHCAPGSQVCAASSGKVTKTGYPYADDLSFRYVEVTDKAGYKCRYFYVEPSLEVGDNVSNGAILGAVQDLDKRYPDITPHFHFEVKSEGGKYLDPDVYLVDVSEE